VPRLAAIVALSLALSSCRDEAAEAFARAQLRYEALVAEGVRPTDPRFDAVLVELRKVPPSSKRHAQAQVLLRGIEGARQRGVRTPLALASDGHRPPELEAQLAACGRIAALAAGDGGVDRRTLEALEACRRAAEKLELRLSHGDTHGHVQDADGGDPHEGPAGHEPLPGPDRAPVDGGAP
jgi:hypothetical protein